MYTNFTYKVLLLLISLLLLGCQPAAVVDETGSASTDGSVGVEESAEIEPTATADPTLPPMPTADPAEETTDPNRVPMLTALAPEGTIISATEPERGHDENISYPFGGAPLPGGVHYPVWQKCGVYYAPLYTQVAIHSMEHGAVWITYDPDTVVGGEVATLAAYTTDEPFVLVSPYPEQDSPIAVTAWGLQLLVDEADDERIQAFIDAFANGPQNPEPGADCAQGITETLSN